MEALMEEVHLMMERDPAAKAIVFSQVGVSRSVFYLLDIAPYTLYLMHVLGCETGWCRSSTLPPQIL